jgi:hypothetical protein
MVPTIDLPEPYPSILAIDNGCRIKAMLQLHGDLSFASPPGEPRWCATVKVLARVLHGAVVAPVQPALGPRPLYVVPMRQLDFGQRLFYVGASKRLRLRGLPGDT